MAEMINATGATVLVLDQTEAHAVRLLLEQRDSTRQWFTDVLERHEQYALDCVADAMREDY